MSDERYDVAGTGSMVVDVISRVPALGRGDDKVLIDAVPGAAPLARFVGGVTLNHLGWAAALGLRTAIFGKIGDDADGRLLRAGMASAGITPHLDPSGSHSAFAHVYVDPRGERAIYMARGATGELRPEEIDALHAPVIERAKLVTSEVSQVPLASVVRVLERAQAAGARTVIDLDVPPSAALPGLGSEAEFLAVLERTDVLKCSAGAAYELVARYAEDAAPGSEASARALADRFEIDTVVVTAGARGAVLLADRKLYEVAAAQVKVTDGTGAGDAFLGGLLVALVRGLAPDDLGRLASAAGAACCEQLGAFPTDLARARARTAELYQELGGTPFAFDEGGPPESSAPLQSATLDYLRRVGGVVSDAAQTLDDAALASAADLVEALEESGGRLHLTGIGKPAHVARYAAALLSSTGTPATFLDGGEATHGSVGQLRSGDLLIAVSNSGSTDELLRAVAAARALGADVIAVTGDPDSPLARAARCTLPVAVDHEGGPLGLAPRNSVLVETLAMCALSVELQARRHFDARDYHARHPAGALGKASRS